MEKLDKNLLCMILNKLSDKDVLNVSLLNKKFQKIVKNYYYKNKVNMLMWQNHNPLYSKPLPCLKLSWHLVHFYFNKLRRISNVVDAIICKKCGGYTHSTQKAECGICGNSCCVRCIKSNYGLQCCPYSKAVCLSCFNDNDTLLCYDCEESDSY